MLTIDEDQARTILEAAQREGLTTTTLPLSSGAPNPLYVIEAEGEVLDEIVDAEPAKKKPAPEPEESEESKNGFIYGLEGIDY